MKTSEKQPKTSRKRYALSFAGLLALILIVFVGLFVHWKLLRREAGVTSQPEPQPGPIAPPAPEEPTAKPIPLGEESKFPVKVISVTHKWATRRANEPIGIVMGEIAGLPGIKNMTDSKCSVKVKVAIADSNGKEIWSQEGLPAGDGWIKSGEKKLFVLLARAKAQPDHGTITIELCHGSSETPKVVYLEKF